MPHVQAICVHEASKSTDLFLHLLSLLLFFPVSVSFISGSRSLYFSPASSLPLLHSFWFSLCLFPILLLLFWCASRSVIQRISGGGVDASESHLSPWHWRAQSQREGWAFSYTLTCFLSIQVKSVHTFKYSEKSISFGLLMILLM